MKTFTLKQICDVLEKHEPDLWRRFNTKFFDAPPTHFDHKYIAAALTMTSAESRKDAQQNSKRLKANLSVIAGLLEKYDFPSYYISGPILDAMTHTKPPVDFTWNDVFFPFPALVFMPPRNTLFEPSGAEIGMIGVAKMKAKEKLPISGTNKFAFNEEWTEDRISVFWSVYCGTVAQDCTFPASQRLEPNVKWIQDKTEEHKDINGMDHGNFPPNQFSSYISGVVANLVMLMSVRSDLIEAGTSTNRKLKSGATIWKPTWLGRKYAVQKEERSKTLNQSHFTEIGWRSGYYRTQNFGPGNNQKKIILVEPYLAHTRGLVKVAGEI